jgi:hypothetical protein
MSYAIMPFRVRLEALRDVLAVRDEALTGWVLGHCRADLAELDQWFDGERPAAEFMADLMLGRPFVDRDAHLYGYCVKALCQVWGVPMANDQWSAMRYGWFDTVAGAVARAGVAYDFAGLVSGGPGVDIPGPDDFPAMGHVTRDELQSQLDTLAGLDPAGVDDEAVLGAVRQVRSWLEQCRRDDMDLVCFYH